jgi:hypothetical protein
MPIDLRKLHVFRIIPIRNLEQNLSEGLFSKNSMRDCNGYISIGSEEVIARRDRARVDCYPGTVVNDYVPFYFSFRTPMLYNIVTGHGVPRQPQASIIYLCCNFMDLISSELVWCYTNGNAASAITRFFTEVENIETNLD